MAVLTRASYQLKWLSIFLWMAFGMLSFVPEKVLAASDIVSKEYQVKAAFLFHLGQFVEWPAASLAETNKPFQIGIFGENPFGNALDEIVKGETIGKRKVDIIYSKRVDELKKCQIVFISKTEKSHITRILKELSGKGLLAVGEIDGFAKRGGGINFYLENDKVRFEMNPTAIERENLKISSQLFRLGKIVKTESDD